MRTRLNTAILKTKQYRHGRDTIVKIKVVVMKMLVVLWAAISVYMGCVGAQVNILEEKVDVFSQFECPIQLDNTDKSGGCFEW